MEGKRGTLQVEHGNQSYKFSTSELAKGAKMFRGLRNKNTYSMKNNGPIFLGDIHVANMYAKPFLQEYKATRNLTLFDVSKRNTLDS